MSEVIKINKSNVSIHSVENDHFIHLRQLSLALGKSYSALTQDWRNHKFDIISELRYKLTKYEIRIPNRAILLNIRLIDKLFRYSSSVDNDIKVDIIKSLSQKYHVELEMKNEIPTKIQDKIKNILEGMFPREIWSNPKINKIYDLDIYNKERNFNIEIDDRYHDDNMEMAKKNEKKVNDYCVQHKIKLYRFKTKNKSHLVILREILKKLHDDGLLNKMFICNQC